MSCIDPFTPGRSALQPDGRRLISGGIQPALAINA